MSYLFFIISIIYSLIFYFFYCKSTNYQSLCIFWNKNNLETDTIYLSWQINTWTNNLIDYISTVSNKWFIITDSFYSISWNLLIESFIFIIIAIVLFVNFSLFLAENDTKNKKTLQEDEKKKNLDFSFFKNFGYISYYIGFFFFYLSAFLITKYLPDINIFNIDLLNYFTFSYVILFVNIVIYLFFYLSSYSKISHDALKINSILFSLYYIINYLNNFYLNINTFNYIDIISSLLIVFSFIVLMHHENKHLLRKSFNDVNLIYFIVYLFFIFLYYSYFSLLRNDIIYRATILSSIYSYLLFEVFSKMKILKNDKNIINILWLLFAYTGLFLAIYYIFIEWDYNWIFDYIWYFFILFSIIFWIYFNYRVHYRYQNYISYFLSLFSFLFLIIHFFKSYIISWSVLFSFSYFLLFLSLSIFLIIISFFLKLRYIYDVYIIHFISYLLNLFSVSIFLHLNNYWLFYCWIILFIDSIYFFTSYYIILNKTKYIKNKQIR